MEAWAGAHGVGRLVKVADNRWGWTVGQAQTLIASLFSEHLSDDNRHFIRFYMCTYFTFVSYNKLLEL